MRKPKTLRPIHPPRSIEAAYRKTLLRLIKRIDGALKESGAVNELTDAVDDVVVSAVASMRAEVAALDVFAQNMAELVVNRTNRIHESRFNKQLIDAVGVDILPQLNQQDILDTVQLNISENVRLITDLADKHIKDIEGVMRRSLLGGGGSLAKDIQRVSKVTKSRAKLIARDQTSKMMNSINKARQEAIGVDEYIWSTSVDERVRDSHREKEGKRFKWSEPPTDTGHPGDDVNCRCTARAVIPLFADL